MTNSQIRFLTEAASNLLVPLEVVSSVGTVVALVLWIRIVREVTVWQRERVAAHTSP